MNTITPSTKSSPDAGTSVPLNQTLYKCNTYIEFLQTWLDGQAKARRGALGRVAQYLKVHPSFVSQVFHGDKDFSLEHAHRFSTYVGLDPDETEYFLIQVQQAKAGTVALKKLFAGQLQRLRSARASIGSRVRTAVELSVEEKATFYSNPYYSLIRLMTSIAKFQDLESLIMAVDLPRAKFHEILEFLLRVGLCHRGAHNRITMGPTHIHIGADEPLVVCHHRNWRLKACEQYPAMRATDLVFTAPVSLSSDDFQKIREKLLTTVTDFVKTASQSPAETCALLNIDWLQLTEPC